MSKVDSKMRWGEKRKGQGKDKEGGGLVLKEGGVGGERNKVVSLIKSL